MDLEEQYDRIYRYCYFKVRQREMAEDLTQETFLRFLESGEQGGGRSMQYLYTVARNLCVDEYRRHKPEPLDEQALEGDGEDAMLTRAAVRMALAELDEADRELLLLRYVNEVPMSVLSGLYGLSRFSLYRRVSQAAKKLKKKLGEEYG
ncbi:MAG: sigma-70 family RNA polymerase sigma factor [Eubacteriales bacterium]|nr:sigma-70 family RNA polymerase sigma factor [Eubacteriales bacterium]